MKIDNTEMYPVLKKSRINMKLFRYIVMAFLVVGFICSFIVNISVGGPRWYIYVLFGEWLFWTGLMSKALIEAGIIKRIINIVIVACMMLFVLDYLSGYEGWSVNTVIPILTFSTLILLSIFFSIEFRRQKQNFLPLFSFLLGSFSIIILSLCKLISFRWPVIVLESYAIAFLIITLIFFLKPLIHEVKKKLHR